MKRESENEVVCAVDHNLWEIWCVVALSILRTPVTTQHALQASAGHLLFCDIHPPFPILKSCFNFSHLKREKVFIKRRIQKCSLDERVIKHQIRRLLLLGKGCGRRRRWHSTPVLLPGKSHGQRSLVGCSPWGH